MTDACRPWCSPTCRAQAVHRSAPRPVIYRRSLVRVEVTAALEGWRGRETALRLRLKVDGLDVEALLPQQPAADLAAVLGELVVAGWPARPADADRTRLPVPSGHGNLRVGQRRLAG